MKLTLSDRILKLAEAVKDLEIELAEGDYWMKRHQDIIENGSCPECYTCDETLFTHGHKEGCYIGGLERKNEDLTKSLQESVVREAKLTRRIMEKSGVLIQRSRRGFE